MKYLVMLAVLPGIVLLTYIYKKDTREKEPFKLLLTCFLLGALAVIPAGIVEGIIMKMIPATILTNFLEYIFVVGLAEEGFKFLFLKARTWNNKNFDYAFDGIVYSVFVSLGFAVLENIFYVVENGFTVGIMRAFTAVPGHMCFAVLMGYFYSGMRFAENYNNKKAYRKNARLVLLVPVIVHGLYDAIVSMGYWITFIIWVGFVVAMFVYCFKLVNRASKNDMQIVLNPLTVVTEDPNWLCPTCNVYCRSNFCPQCGTKRP